MQAIYKQHEDHCLSFILIKFLTPNTKIESNMSLIKDEKNKNFRSYSPPWVNPAEKFYSEAYVSLNLSFDCFDWLLKQNVCQNQGWAAVLMIFVNGMDLLNMFKRTFNLGYYNYLAEFKVSFRQDQ